jgi:glyoxylase-like metal-dependent hydrolase (beta-lactamase superfamily II)
MADSQSTSIDSIYAQVRAAMPDGGHREVAATLLPVAPSIRVLALRTPTLPPATHTNAYVVGPTGGPVVVVDPGSPYPEVQRQLADALAGEQVSRVLLTHHHGDHIGGAIALGVPITAHAITRALLADIVPIDAADTLADGDTLDLAGIRITAIHTPGHARGHLCFAVGDAVIAGDMVAGIGTILIDPDEGDMTDYLASLAKLAARGPHALLPAHGPMIADGVGKLRDYTAHRLMREARVLAAIAGREAPSTIAELVPIAYADTPPALWIIAERSLRAHVHKLVADGKVTADRTSADSRYSAAQ